MGLTDKQKADYLKASHKCPYCQSPDIEGEEVECNGDSHYQDIHCDACGATWTDVYTLSDITESE